MSDGLLIQVVRTLFITAVSLVVVATSSGQQPTPSPRDSGDDQKATLCHVPPGNPANGRTIFVDEIDVPEHLAHGDHRGPCDADGAPDCVGRCEISADALLETCSGETGNLDQCQERTARFRDRCLDRCGENSQPPCEVSCGQAFEQTFGECVAAGTNPNNCRGQATRGLVDCLRGCRGPNADAPCESRCAHEATEARRACVDVGIAPSDCAVTRRATMQDCTAQCAHQTSASCEAHCLESAEGVFESCMAIGGTVEACATQADEVLERCLRHCRKPAPPPLPCEQHCERIGESAFDECVEDGDAEEECAMFATDVAVACVALCAIPVTDDSCEDRCALAEEALLAECLADGKPEASCQTRAKKQREKCARHCTLARGVPMIADFDLDGDSDLSDALTFLECFSGPGNPKRDECLDADTDFDGDVDLSDAVQMMANFGRVE